MSHLQQAVSNCVSYSDVKHGATIVAGGDVLVWGRLAICIFPWLDLGCTDQCYGLHVL